MADVMFPTLAVCMFGLPGAYAIFVVARRWRDRPAAWSLGWLCIATTALTYAAGSVATAAGPQATSAVLGLGLVSAISLATTWLLARCRQWWSGRAMKRLAAAEGHPVPRGRLTVPVLVIVYVAAMVTSMIVAVGLWAYTGAAWMGHEFTLAGVPLIPAIVPTVLLCLACVSHIVLREVAPVARDLWEAWLQIGRR